MENILSMLITELMEHVKRLEKKQKELDIRLKDLEKQHRILKRQMEEYKGISIFEYGEINDIPIFDECISHLSIKASKISRDKGYKIGSTSHPLYGRVNTYHVDVLDEVFECVC